MFCNMLLCVVFYNSLSVFVLFVFMFELVFVLVLGPAGGGWRALGRMEASWMGALGAVSEASWELLGPS